MKKIKLDGKLSLNKETIAKLNDEQMRNVNGGRFGFTEQPTHCVHTCPTYPATHPEDPNGTKCLIDTYYCGG